MKKIRTWLVTILVCYLVAVLLNRYVIIKVVVDGASMSPTLTQGDAGISDRLTFRLFGIGRFDIVMFETASIEDPEVDEVWIKRVIGLPGETVFYDEDGLYINQMKVEETFLSGNLYEDTCGVYYNGTHYVTPAVCISGVTLQENEYFLMGDNRDNSYDSRMLPSPVLRDQMIGRGLILYGRCEISNETCQISQYYVPRFLGW